MPKNQNQPPQQEGPQQQGRFQRWLGKVGIHFGQQGQHSEIVRRPATYREYIATFADNLADVQQHFAELVVPLPDRTPAHLNRYKLIPLEVDDGEDGIPSNIEPGVKVTYVDRSGPQPLTELFLDARRGVGLVYDNSLIAVAAGHVEADSTLMITQLQDVTGVRREDNQRAYFRTGLHNGFSWRDTLVNVMEQVAVRSGVAAIGIQSYENSKWPEVIEAGPAGFDTVAQRMGYNPPQYNGDNWVKPTANIEPIV